jgi:hypothetical protein
LQREAGGRASPVIHKQRGSWTGRTRPERTPASLAPRAPSSVRFPWGERAKQAPVLHQGCRFARVFALGFGKFDDVLLVHAGPLRVRIGRRIDSPDSNLVWASRRASCPQDHTSGRQNSSFWRMRASLGHDRVRSASRKSQAKEERSKKSVLLPALELLVEDH